ncbi:serine/threonine-protein phosphatase, partial [Clostridium perfringens]
MEDLSFFESYGIVAAALITVAVLLVMRQKLRTSPAVETTPENSELLYIPDIIETNKIGNAQTIGKREEQDDYFSSSTTKIGTMAVIADGISGLSHGRMASTLAVTVFSREYLK